VTATDWPVGTAGVFAVAKRRVMHLVGVVE